MLWGDVIIMMVEIVTALFIALGAIGGIMALKWKKGNVTPRLSDEEKEKFLNKGRDTND
jgi:hypothetical protein